MARSKSCGLRFVQVRSTVLETSAIPGVDSRPPLSNRASAPAGHIGDIHPLVAHYAQTSQPCECIDRTGLHRGFRSSLARPRWRLRQQRCKGMAVIGVRDGATPARRRVDLVRGVATGIVAASPMFDGFGPADLHAAMQLLDGPVHLPRRHILFAEGDAGDRMYLVLFGRVKVSRRMADGRHGLLAVLGPSDVFGEWAIFDPGPRKLTATASSNIAVVSMDRNAMRSWIRERPELAEQMLQTFARRLRRAQEDLTYLGSATVAERLAAQLLALAERFGTSDGRVVRVSHGLTQDEIAQLIGSSRESVGKILTEFSRRGWIRIFGRSVTIMNAERLAMRARCPAVPYGPSAITA